MDTQRYHIIYDDLYADTIRAASDADATREAIGNLPNDNISHSIEIYTARLGDLDAVAHDDYDGSDMQEQMRKRTPLISMTTLEEAI